MHCVVIPVNLLLDPFFPGWSIEGRIVKPALAMVSLPAALDGSNKCQVLVVERRPAVLVVLVGGGKGCSSCV